ncbi:unnamed protein product [Caenorhabditis sp. 36 PRJEB53466]|nr:unnamed protein product [Caenorhabditis sp. 36 PRJEB53466]
MEAQQLMGFTLVPIALIGSICNWLVVISIQNNRSLNYSFSLLTANQAIFNGLHSTTFLFYVFPMVSLFVRIRTLLSKPKTSRESQFLLSHSHHCGFFLMICYDVAMQSHLLITINRFCAVFHPIVYKRLFSSKWTKRIIYLSLLYALIELISFFQILPCNIYYDSELWGFAYTDLPICTSYGIFGDCLKLILMAIFNVIVDFITISKGLHALIYFFFISPMIVFDVRFLITHSFHVGYFILIVYDSSMQIHFIMAINRFIAVFTPFRYKKVFSKKNTHRICLLSFSVSFIIITIFFKILGCQMRYLDDFWVFDYSQQPVCLFYMNVNDIAKVSGMALLNVLIDTTTIVKIKIGKRKLQKDSSSKKLSKKEVDFVKQSFGQSLPIFFGLSLYTFFPEVLNDPARAFILSTLFWCSLHAFDGFVLALILDIQKSIRKALNRKSNNGNTCIVLAGKSTSGLDLKF